MLTLNMVEVEMIYERTHVRSPIPTPRGRRSSNVLPLGGGRGRRPEDIDRAADPKICATIVKYEKRWRYCVSFFQVDKEDIFNTFTRRRPEKEKVASIIQAIGGHVRDPPLPEDDDDTEVRVVRIEWKLRMDSATNELEDLLADMEAAVEAEKKGRWWWVPWQRCRAATEVVAGWLGSDAKNKVKMELAVGRLAGVYVQGGELFDDIVKYEKRWRYCVSFFQVDKEDIFNTFTRRRPEKEKVASIIQAIGGHVRDPPLPEDDDDTEVRVVRIEWKLRMDSATNELEDLLADMEAAVEAEKKGRWWWVPWQRCRAATEVVAGWLGSDAKNKVKMELAVGRLAGVYVQGGELFDDVRGP
uniref:Uncharacterized protein n=1 Tax=Oryza brachyantha TaxID=4533 RepID=J3MLF0_ORYBR